MTKPYSIERDNGIAIMRLHTTVDLADMLRMYREIVDEVSENRRLWISSNHFVFTAREIDRMAELGRSLWPNENTRVAYLAEDALSFNLLKVLEVQRRDVNYEIKVFRDFDKAKEWLRDWEG